MLVGQLRVLLQLVIDHLFGEILGVAQLPGGNHVGNDAVHLTDLVQCLANGCLGLLQVKNHIELFIDGFQFQHPLVACGEIEEVPVHALLGIQPHPHHFRGHQHGGDDPGFHGAYHLRRDTVTHESCGQLGPGFRGEVVLQCPARGILPALENPLLYLHAVLASHVQLDHQVVGALVGLHDLLAQGVDVGTGQVHRSQQEDRRAWRVHLPEEQLVLGRLCKLRCQRTAGDGGDGCQPGKSL